MQLSGPAVAEHLVGARPVCSCMLVNDGLISLLVTKTVLHRQ